LFNAQECFPISFSSKCHSLKPAGGKKKYFKNMEISKEINGTARHISLNET